MYAWGKGHTKVPVENENLEEVAYIGTNYYLSQDVIVRCIKDNSIIRLSLNEYDPSEPAECLEERIMQVSEGKDHVMLLGESGRVYSYGKNTYGQLGDGKTVSRENMITTVVRTEDWKYT